MQFVIEQNELKEALPSGSESSITIPEGVTSIKFFAFSNCEKLKSITILKSMMSVNACSFQYSLGSTCKLENILVSPENPTYASVDGVLYNKALTELIVCPAGKKNIQIPVSVISIGEFAFRDCAELKSITMPDQVNNIGMQAFKGCVNLKSITIPSSVIDIGEEAFYQCEGLKSVDIPGSVARIGKQAFCRCVNLKSVVINDGVESIGEEAFCLCYKLSSIVIPKSVTSIGRRAFWSCGNLNKLKLPDSLTTMGEDAFGLCESLTSINIPKRLTTINDLVFCGCSKLTSIIIPNGVTAIGKDAFNSCELKSITIPGSVRSIGKGAFDRIAGQRISAPAGSYAAEYAKTHRIALEVIGNEIEAIDNADTRNIGSHENTKSSGEQATKSNKSSSTGSSKKSKFNKALKVRLDQCLEVYKGLASFCEEKEENEATDFLQGYFLLLCFALSNGSPCVNQKKLDCLEYYIQVSLNESSYSENMRRMKCTKEKIQQFLGTPPEPLKLCIIADNTMKSSPIDTTISEFFINIVEDFAVELANCNESINNDEITATKNYVKLLRDFVDECSKMDNVFRLLGTENYLKIMIKTGAL
ncbi:MAG: leucine-rich repeat domain-containing protein [Christensenella sp.]|nr:leucine-rich repeat domain-containing protein [Christensenella sp.]